MRRSDFDRLYEQHASSLFAFVVYRVGSRAVAEDLVADTFERALRAHRRFDERRGSEATWLYAIALNVVRDHGRRAGAESRAMDRLGDDVLRGPGGDQEIATLVAQRDELQRALARLSEHEREALALRYGAGLSIKELAKVTGERETTADGRVHRALRKLRAELVPPAG